MRDVTPGPGKSPLLQAGRVQMLPRPGQSQRQAAFRRRGDVSRRRFAESMGMVTGGDAAREGRSVRDAAAIGAGVVSFPIVKNQGTWNLW